MITVLALASVAFWDLIIIRNYLKIVLSAFVGMSSWQLHVSTLYRWRAWRRIFNTDKGWFGAVSGSDTLNSQLLLPNPLTSSSTLVLHDCQVIRTEIFVLRVRGRRREAEWLAFVKIPPKLEWAILELKHSDGGPFLSTSLNLSIVSIASRQELTPP